MRMASESPGISMLKTATGRWVSMATFSARFIAKLVLPMDGRPATMIRSEVCSPEVISSKSGNPVGSPVMALVALVELVDALDRLDQQGLDGWKPPPPR